MVTPTKRVKIHLGKETFHLRYGHMAFVELEEASGKTIQEHQTAMTRGSAVSITWLVWAGIVHDRADLKFRDIASLMDFKSYVQYAEAIGEALKIALGEEEPGNEKGDD